MTDREWERLGDDWRAASREQDGGVELQSLRLVVARRARRRALLIVVEPLLSAAVLWWTFTQVRGTGAAVGAARAAVLVLTASVWAYVWWNRRHVWRPLGETTADYLRLMHEQLDASERSVRVVGVVLGTVAAVWVPWVVWRIAFRPLRSFELALWLCFGLYLAAMLGGGAWYRRRIRRERTTLRAVAEFVAEAN
jgi:hypothetical protein